MKGRGEHTKLWAASWSDAKQQHFFVSAWGATSADALNGALCFVPPSPTGNYIQLESIFKHCREKNRRPIRERKNPVLPFLGFLDFLG